MRFGHLAPDPGAVLTSVKNPKVAAAVRLKKRAFREEDRRFLVEGAQGVGEALEQPGTLLSLFVSDGLDPLAVRARQSGVDVNEVSADVMAKLTSTVTPQGIVGVCSVPRRRIRRACRATGVSRSCTRCATPGNAGTVLRSADAAGAGGVVFTASSVDVYNPKTVRSSAGRSSICRSSATREPPTALRARSRTRGCASSRWTGTATRSCTRST